MVIQAKKDLNLGIIGCGTMGACIISALLGSHFLNPEQIQGSVQHPESMEKLQKQFPTVTFTLDNEDIAGWANVLLIW